MSIEKIPENQYKTLIFYIDNFKKDKAQRSTWLYELIKILKNPVVIACDEPICDIFRTMFVNCSISTAMKNRNAVAVSFSSCSSSCDAAREGLAHKKILIVDTIEPNRDSFQEVITLAPTTKIEEVAKIFEKC
jgi:hypothetical protein